MTRGTVAAGGLLAKGGGGGAPAGVGCAGSDLVCPEGTRCQLDVEGKPSSCVVSCDDEARTCGDAMCCGAGASCVAGGCKAADLVVEAMPGSGAVTFATAELGADSCEVQQGYVSGPGRHLFTRFSVLLKNVSDAPLVLGHPAGSELFAPNFCEDSYVVPRFLRARVKIGDAVVVEKELDARCIAGAGGQFSCEAQGLAPGEQVVQPATGSTGAMDMTGLAGGLYDLEITVNPDRVIAETSFDNNSVVIPIDFPACDGSMCGGTCCPEGVECRADVCMVPDLRPNAARVAETLNFTYQTFAADSCEIQEGCITGPGRRHLMQFEGRIENAGPGDLNPGREQDNPLFEFAQCHNHYHFKNFTDYKLLDVAEQLVAQGHKQSFCLVDIAPLDPTNPAPRGDRPPGSGCNFLSAGWADVYGAGTSCQWVDVTDVPEGDYLLRVAVNPTSSIAEVSTDDNVVDVPVHVPGFVPCIPQPEVCGDWIDQDCDGIADNGCSGPCTPHEEVCGNWIDDDCNAVVDDGCEPILGADDCATPGELTASMHYTADITATNTSDVSLPCGGEGGEVFFHLVLPADEVVYLGTFESELDTVLAVLPGDGCAGVPLACAAATCGPDTLGASFAGRLAAGSYTVVVKAVSSGALGRVRLKFEHSSCLGAGATVIDGTDVSGDTTGAPMPTVSMCSAVSPEQEYYLPLCPFKRLTVSSCGLSSFPMAIKVARDACNQSSFLCSGALSDCAGDPAGTTVTLSSADPGGGLGAVTVSGRTPVDFGPYSLTLTRAESICEAVDLGSTVPQTVLGSTVGGIDAVSPSCAALGGNDSDYTFTAPADGLYHFDTVGSSFDTVLHIHDAACTGRELACDDDSAGSGRSRVQLTLVAGQTVSVVVDGWGSFATGAYVLNITD